MKYINLTNGIVPAMILTVLEEQPPDKYGTLYITNTEILVYGMHHHKIFGTYGKLDEIIKLPYTVGDVVGCRETWGIVRDTAYYNGCCFDGGYHYVYKADYTEEQIKRLKTKWHSPDNDMPAEAIRKWAKVISVDCKQVQETLAIESIRLIPPMSTGAMLKEEFINWFNAKYAKPRPVKKAGKIVSYVCYAYSMETMNMTSIGHYDLNGIREYEYKGLPLKIIANPWVALTRIEETKP